MSYPKPLSEKSLERLYRESGLTMEAKSFLHDFFASCANLYGAITLRHVWKIYQELKDDAPKLRRKDLMSFASIVRREEQPYYIFEVNELFDEDAANELDRHIVSKELVSVGYGRFHFFYSLMEQIDDKPYCIPDDFLSYASPVPSKQETNLLHFLSNLKSVSDECVPKFGKSVPNEHKGMKLGDFSFLNSDERFELEWQKRPSAKAAFLADCSGTVAEKILRFYKRGENIGRASLANTLQWIVNELEEVGVKMTKEKIERLLHLTTDYHNNSRLWNLSGWKPCELAAMYRGNRPAAITFGPGLQKAFADGVIDRDELVGKMQEMGLQVLEQK